MQPVLVRLEKLRFLFGTTLFVPFINSLFWLVAPVLLSQCSSLTPLVVGGCRDWVLVLILGFGLVVHSVLVVAAPVCIA
jgi:hypothetical protein